MHAVPEAHQPDTVLAVPDPLDERPHVTAVGVDALQYGKDGLIGAAV
jgi:hypothetical protein